MSVVARIDEHEWHDAENIGVPVSVTDTTGTGVVRAVITMYITPRMQGGERS